MRSKKWLVESTQIEVNQFNLRIKYDELTVELRQKIF